MDGEKVNICVNASSLVIGILLKEVRTILGDACWLHPMNNATHINLAELDAMLKDGRPRGCICGQTRYVSDISTGKARIQGRAASEKLIKRRLETIK